MEEKLIWKHRLLILVAFITGTVLTYGTYFPKHPAPLLQCERDIVGKEVFLLPSVDKINTLNRSAVMALLYRYTNTYQILCRNQLRIGRVYDGGKDVCIDKPIVPKKPCLVYSFGSKNRFDFESDIIRWFGCEVHTFDPRGERQRPSKTLAGMDHLPMTKIENPPGCIFHRTGLSNETKVTDKGWRLQTLGKTMKDLNHENRILDILKMDIDGAEWESINQMIESGDVYRVKQLQVELHFLRRERFNSTNQIVVIKKLHECGFKVFNRERNVFCKTCNLFSKELGYTVSYNVEMGYINTNLL